MTAGAAPPYPGAVTRRGPLGDWWVRNFVKRRFVLARDTPGAPDRAKVTLVGYDVVGYGAGAGRELPAPQRRSLAQAIGEERLARRLADQDLTAFVAVAPDGATAGFVWSLAPRAETAWHDNVPVRPGTALLFHGYVAPEHRRHGLFTWLMTAVQDHCLLRLGRERVLGVVEASNVPSLRTLGNLGYEHVADNYLVKVLGVNVVSVLRWRERRGTEAHFVFMRPRGRSR